MHEIIVYLSSFACCRLTPPEWVIMIWYNQSYNLPTVDYRQELSGYTIFIYGYCPEIKVEVGNMHCRLNHTLSSAYSVRGGYKWAYTISIPISNHNQLCYTTGGP
ncbi:hypothetical protein [Bacteroides eggerthii]|uniref:hypothetical protein n=1 Tax=Bacteroides eggerthii TaxID=28111 RepID=UPI0011C430FD|nr:hypothetical protein [Bacteroides eggerthii]